MTIVEKAIKFAKEAHKGQVRKFSGEPYYNHCARVAQTVSGITNNHDLICGALLHDTIEDCGITSVLIEREFNPVVSTIVWELSNRYTKEGYPTLPRKERKQKELDRIAKISWSAKLLKLADRKDNIESFAKEDSTWGPSHYYVRETKDLLKVLRGIDLNLEMEIEDILTF